MSIFTTPNTYYFAAIDSIFLTVMILLFLHQTMCCYCFRKVKYVTKSRKYVLVLLSTTALIETCINLVYNFIDMNAYCPLYIFVHSPIQQVKQWIPFLFFVENYIFYIRKHQYRKYKDYNNNASTSKYQLMRFVSQRFSFIFVFIMSILMVYLMAIFCGGIIWIYTGRSCNIFQKFSYVINITGFIFLTVTCLMFLIVFIVQRVNSMFIKKESLYSTLYQSFIDDDPHMFKLECALVYLVHCIGMLSFLCLEFFVFPWITNQIPYQWVPILLYILLNYQRQIHFYLLFTSFSMFADGIFVVKQSVKYVFSRNKSDIEELQRVLNMDKNQLLYQSFSMYCEKSWSSENLDFFEKMKLLLHCKDEKIIKSIVKSIYEEHVRIGSTGELNINSQNRKTFISNYLKLQHNEKISITECNDLFKGIVSEVDQNLLSLFCQFKQTYKYKTNKTSV